MKAQTDPAVYWSCLRKARFVSRKEALHMRRRITRQHVRRLVIYACRYCGFYHHASRKGKR